MSKQLLDDLEAFEKDQRVAKQLAMIDHGVASLQLEELLTHIERNDRVRRYAHAKLREAKNNVERAAWSCLDSELKHLRETLIKRAEVLENKREKLRSPKAKGGSYRRQKRRRKSSHRKRRN